MDEKEIAYFRLHFTSKSTYLLEWFRDKEPYRGLIVRLPPAFREGQVCSGELLITIDLPVETVEEAMETMIKEVEYLENREDSN
jgi:hypothetical protein